MRKIPIFTTIILCIIGYIYIYHFDSKYDSNEYYYFVDRDFVSQNDLAKKQAIYLLNYSIAIFVISALFYTYEKSRKLLFYISITFIGVILYKCLQSIINDDFSTFYKTYYFYLIIFPLSIIIAHLISIGYFKDINKNSFTASVSKSEISENKTDV